MSNLVTVRSWVRNVKITFQNNRVDTAICFPFVAAGGLILAWDGRKSRKCGDKAAVTLMEVSLRCVLLTSYKMGKDSSKLGVIKVLKDPLRAKCDCD